MSTYAIGDIQGCFDEFRLILDQCQFDPGKDRLWLVGDLINRGPKNLETLQFILGLGDCVTTVLGNHDLHFLAVARGFGKVKKGDTFTDLLESDQCSDLADWIRNRPLIHYDSQLGFVMIHAGLPPTWSVQTCIERAKEVEAVLGGNSCDAFLQVMYGDEPSSWSDELHGMDRIRLITNYFTRLRYCTADGKLELTHKTSVSPEGYKPWFQYPRKLEMGGAKENQKPISILFGHWAALEGKTGAKDIYNLDTGCVWGNCLTAMKLEDRDIFTQKALKTN